MGPYKEVDIQEGDEGQPGAAVCQTMEVQCATSQIQAGRSHHFFEVGQPGHSIPTNSTCMPRMAEKPANPAPVKKAAGSLQRLPLSWHIARQGTNHKHMMS